MSTLNQEKAAKEVKEVIEKKLDKTGADVLKSVGYGRGYQISPSRVFKSKGFQEALKKLGFSVESADLTIAKILRTGKEENQIRASQEVYKRLGAYKQGDNNIINNVLVIPSEIAEKYGVKVNDTNAITKHNS